MMAKTKTKKKSATRRKLSNSQIIQLAQLIVKKSLSLREAAVAWNSKRKNPKYKISKTTVSFYIKILAELDRDLYNQVKEVQKQNCLNIPYNRYRGKIKE